MGVCASHEEGECAAETLFFDYRPEHGMRNQGRLHLHYVWDARPRREVVPSFQTVQDQPTTIYGDGTRTRWWSCCVADLIESIVRLMRSDDRIGPIKVGSFEKIAVRSWPSRFSTLPARVPS